MFDSSESIKKKPIYVKYFIYTYQLLHPFSLLGLFSKEKPEFAEQTRAET